MTWRSKLIVFGLCLVTFLSLADDITKRAPANPLRNGNFEKINKQGVPRDWVVVGDAAEREVNVTTWSSHSGKRAVRLMAKAKEFVGLECSSARLSRSNGWVTFWFKAERLAGDNVRVSAIPVVADNREVNSASIDYVVPPHFAGDGEWHYAALFYDYSKIEDLLGVKVSLRINDGGLLGPSEIIFDQLEWHARVDAVIQISEIKFQEDKSALGYVGTVVATVENIGGELARDLDVSVAAREGLRIQGPKVQAVTAISPFGREIVGWRVVGKRNRGDSVSIVIRSPLGSVRGRLQLASRLVANVTLDRFILDRGDTTKVRLRIENRGTAFTRNRRVPFVPGQGLEVLGDKIREMPSIAPGGLWNTTWTVRANGEKMGWCIGKVAEIDGCPVTANLLVVPHMVGEQQQPWAWPITKGEHLSLAGVLENEYLKIIIPNNKCLPMRAIEFQVRKNGEWQTVAKSGWLSRRVYATGDGLCVRQADTNSGELVDDASKREGVLSFAKVGPDKSGVEWREHYKFSVQKGAKWVDVEYLLSVNQPSHLYYWEGPSLFVGEGSFGAKKDEALFPGLEWLEGEERSSSDLDIASVHPDRIRFVPHPNKITIPCMSIYHEGILIGMMWDSNQKWDGVHSKPAAKFASPNWPDGLNSHMLGLFLPSVGCWVKENVHEPLWNTNVSLGNTVSYQLTPDHPLSLKCQIVLDPEARGALDIVDHWFARHGVPEPLVPPRGDWRAEVEFSMKAYLDSLWIMDEKAWWKEKGSPLWGLTYPIRSPQYLHDLFMGAAVTRDEGLAARCRERGAEVIEESGLQPAGDDDGFTWGDPLQALAHRASRSAVLLERRFSDGSWRFDAESKGQGIFKGMDYSVLGLQDAVGLGLTARPTYELLRYAMLSGDVDAFSKAKKSLEFMKRFHVPRAAQTWEVPVHAPDLLAAADAVDAYIEAYRFSGDKEYIFEAVRWARAGLPFIYVWSEPQFPFMRYASKPVLGASWRQQSWFGHAVQWNGLRYAYALLKLGEYDGTLPWRQIGEGITVSALYQQHESGDDVALWPDSVSMLTGEMSERVFAPGIILKNVYELMGIPAEPQIFVLREKGWRVHISTRGEIKRVQWSGTELYAEIELPEQLPGVVLVSPVNRPKDVRVNGNRAEWRYDAVQAAATVNLPLGFNGIVRITGVRNTTNGSVDQ